MKPTKRRAAYVVARCKVDNWRGFGVIAKNGAAVCLSTTRRMANRIAKLLNEEVIVNAIVERGRR